MAFTSTPRGPSSSAMDRVRLITPGLRGDERALQAKRHQAGDGGDVDHAPARAFQHRPDRGTAHQIEPVQIDGDDAVPFRAGEPVDGDAMVLRVHAGIVDENVEPAVAIERGRDGRFDRLLVAHIHREPERIGQLRRHGRGARAVDIRHRNARAVPGIGARDRSADPVRGTGDESDLAFQIDLHPAAAGFMIS